MRQPSALECTPTIRTDRKLDAPKIRQDLLSKVAEIGLYANQFFVCKRGGVDWDPPAVSHDANQAIERWTQAMAWGRAVDRTLLPLDLTHTQFLVLLGAAVATAEQRDSVMQQDIADAVGLDKGTTSLLVRKLGKAGLLDRNINGVDERKLRIFDTGEGRRRLDRACALLDAVAPSLGRG